jgi:hypothetical protein
MIIIKRRKQRTIMERKMILRGAEAGCIWLQGAGYTNALPRLEVSEFPPESAVSMQPSLQQTLQNLNRFPLAQ